MKAKMEAESKALQEKLDKEASALKNKLTEGEESRKKESKALQDKLEKDKEALAKQVSLKIKFSSLGLGFLNPMSQLRRANVTAFCMQLGNQLVKN